MDYLLELLLQTWHVMLELSPSLLLGLAIAGLLHVFLPMGLIRKSMAGANLKSVINAVLVGAPMPLCSCGVVPTALGLRNEGASKGAATGFLISTPQTGVDSILVSATMLGWPFALFKVGAAVVTGLLGGTIVNAIDKEKEENASSFRPLSNAQMSTLGFGARLIEAVRYALIELLGAIDLWIIIGVIVSALISVLIPSGSLSDISWLNGIGGMLTVLAIAMPMYVCTTGSVPIAASLIAAGMPMGSALVFLMAGPATNVATMGAVYRSLGKKVLVVYVGVVAIMSVSLGYVFDFVLGSAPTGLSMNHHVDAGWWQIALAVLMSGLLLWLVARRLHKKFFSKALTESADDGALIMEVGGMTCNHCASTVKNAIEADPDVEQAIVDLSSGRVKIVGSLLNKDKLGDVIERAGYKVIKENS